MTTETETSTAAIRKQTESQTAPMENWLVNLRVLWAQRRTLMRVAGISFLVSLAVSLIIPKIYISQAKIMPPEMSDSRSTLLASIVGRAPGAEGLGELAAALTGGRTTGALFVDLLQSDSVVDPLVERFQLQHAYHKRYRVDAAKKLINRTTVTQDKKSGVITVAVKDTDPERARDIAQAYIDQLDLVVGRTNTSPAHYERAFIQRRLQEVRRNLDFAQEAMSDFSSTHSTIDLKDQTIETVESQAKVQGELIASESELESLEQIYGDANIRVRTTTARIDSLKRELARLGGTSDPLPAQELLDPKKQASTNQAYLPLRQVPRLAVPYANLYRDLHVQETVYDFLTQQYEAASIQEAKDTPAVNVIDVPGIPEKKSFPPRALLTLGLTALSLGACCLFLILRYRLQLIDTGDPRIGLAREMVASIGSLVPSRFRRASA